MSEDSDEAKASHVEALIAVCIDPGDIVHALKSNDEQMLGFIVGILELAGSVDLRERLLSMLDSWDEDGRP